MIRKSTYLVASAVVASLWGCAVAQADPVSPHINDGGRTYSMEAPNSQFYGTGIGGGMTEASELRFECERLLQTGKVEEAAVKAKKAVQLDPSDPQTHMLLARILTKRFYAKPGPVDEKLLGECLTEWRLIWHHDADQLEQTEAKWQARKLDKIAKGLAKEKELKEKDQREAKAALAKERDAGKQKVAVKKRRFLLF